MSFQKVGSPQPLDLMPEKCQICNKNKAEFSVDGKFICAECKKAQEQTQEENTAA